MQVKQIKGLSKLTKLRELYLHSNRIGRMENLSHLTNLEVRLRRKGQGPRTHRKLGAQGLRTPGNEGPRRLECPRTVALDCLATAVPA